MESKLEWLSEDEGTITFLENETKWMSIRFFLTGEEEAELKIQDMVYLAEYLEHSEKQEIIISKMTWCLKEAFLLLWNEGFEEVVLAERKKSDLAEILDSTDVVEAAYSEYMMKRRIQKYETTSSCDEDSLIINQEPTGFFCENRDRTFSCRLLSYSESAPKERCFYLYEVEVEEGKRNQGIGTECLERLFQQLAREQTVTVYLQVGSYNEPAVHLYQKLGFEITEEVCYYGSTEIEEQ